MAVLVEVGNHVEHDIRPCIPELVAVVGESLERPVDVADARRQIGFLLAAVKHRDVVTVAHKSPNDVGAYEPGAAENDNPHSQTDRGTSVL